MWGRKVDDTPKKVAYWVVVALLGLAILPVIAFALMDIAGQVKGSEKVGGLLLTLIGDPSGPMSVVQKSAIPLLGVITLPILWREKGRFAIGLIILCFLGLICTLYSWSQLTDVDKAADLWQDSHSTRLDGMTFPAAMTSYMKSITWLLIVDIAGVFGLKGIERLLGGSNG